MDVNAAGYVNGLWWGFKKRENGQAIEKTKPGEGGERGRSYIQRRSEIIV